MIVDYSLDIVALAFEVGIGWDNLPSVEFGQGIVGIDFGYAFAVIFGVDDFGVDTFGVDVFGVDLRSLDFDFEVVYTGVLVEVGLVGSVEVG